MCPTSGPWVIIWNYQLVLVVRPCKKRVDECWKKEKVSLLLNTVVVLHIMIYQCNIWYFRYEEVVNELVYIWYIVYLIRLQWTTVCFTLQISERYSCRIILSIDRLVFIFCRGTQFFERFWNTAPSSCLDIAIEAVNDLIVSILSPHDLYR